jgi:hypothetical protein
MEDDNDNVNDDEETGSLDDDTDSNAEMTRTIEQMEESDIRAIVSIFQTAFVHDYNLVKKRQLDYSVEAFRRTFPSINSNNLGTMERKIKDARCFFMILQEIHASRKVRLLARSAQNNLFHIFGLSLRMYIIKSFIIRTLNGHYRIYRMIYRYLVVVRLCKKSSSRQHHLMKLMSST